MTTQTALQLPRPGGHDERLLQSLCDGCPEIDCGSCPVTGSMARYAARKKKQDRTARIVAGVTFVVVLFVGLLVWQIWSTHTLVAQHSIDIRRTAYLAQQTQVLAAQVLKLETTAQANHAGTLSELRGVEHQLALICQTVKCPGGTP